MKYKGYKSIMAVGVALSLLAGVSEAEAAKVIKYNSKKWRIVRFFNIMEEMIEEAKTKEKVKWEEQY